MNRREYKKSMSGVRPSEQTIERIFTMTVDKKAKKNHAFKRIASATLALAILVGCGYGASQLVSKNNDIEIVKSTKNAIVEAVNPLSVMVAYAEDGVVNQVPLKLGTETPVYYQLDIIEINGASEDEIEKKVESLMDDNSFFENKKVTEVRLSTERHDGFLLRQAIANSFVLGIEKPENVKNITLKSNSGYWRFDYRDYSKGIENEDAFVKGQSLDIDGDTYVGLIKYDKEHYTDALEINLNHTEKLCEEIEKNPKLDLSKFNDTLTFTVEYKDGSVEQANIDISLNQNGRMMMTVK